MANKYLRLASSESGQAKSAYVWLVSDASFSAPVFVYRLVFCSTYVIAYTSITILLYNVNVNNMYL